MRSTKKELLATLNKISGLPILVVGDIMLDRYMFGKVDRISPEAPVPVVHVRSIQDRLGGAGNTVRNLCNLGAKVSLCGLIGTDSEGKSVLRMLDEIKVNREGVMTDSERPTTLKTRLIAQHQQVVRIDREEIPNASFPLDPDLADRYARYAHSLISSNRAVIFSDYGKGAITPQLIDLFEEARQGGSLAVGATPLTIDPHPSHYSLYRGMSIAKPNRKEAEAATGISISDRETASQAAHQLLSKWNAEMLLISLSEDGLVIAQSNGEPEIFRETVAREVSDVSGAGDTVTAVFSAAIAAGATPALAGDLANIAAGVVVSEVGTVPVDLAKLVKEIEAL